MAQMERGEVKVKLSVDAADAVVELKRLQRVARETVKELREVESLTVSGRVDLSGVPTKELVDELARRDGIELINIGYYDQYEVRNYTYEQWIAQSEPYYRVHDTGPAKIVIVNGEI